MILTKSPDTSIDIDKIIIEKVNSSRVSELLQVVPTNRKVRYLKRDIINISPDNSSQAINLETLETLTYKIFEHSREFDSNLLSDATSVVLIEQSFSEVNLRYFNVYKNEIPRGTLEIVKNVISEYKRQGISPDDLEKQADYLTGSEKLKALDISDIYRAYQKKIDNLNAYELGDLYNYVNNLNNEKFIFSFTAVFPVVDCIVVNGFDEFSQPEINLIDKMATLPSSKLFISFDYFKRNKNIFSHLGNCYTSLINRNFREADDISSSSFDHFRKRVRENLFSDKLFHPVKSNVEIVQASLSDESKEIETIAKEIKRLTLNEKVETSDICVAFNLISDHSALVRDIFSSYGIPYNLTDRFTLSNSIPVIALINFLEILENDFYYKNIFRALNGRWIEINGIDISNLLAVSINLKLISGYENWINSIDTITEQISGSSDFGESRYLYGWQYKKAKQDIISIYNLLFPFSSKQTVTEFRENLAVLIDKLNIKANLINDFPDCIEKNVKAFTVLIETVDELLGLIRDENGENKIFPLAFYLKEMRTAFPFSRYNVKERHGKGVLVTSVNEIRGLRFKYLFLGGMVDGEFPTRYQPAIFFSGEHKIIRNETRHLLEERYRFYQALCVPEKRIYITRALKGDKKELAESSFINALEKIFVIRNVAENEYGNLIYSKEELLTSPHIQNQENLSDQININRLNKKIKTDTLRNKDPFGKSDYTGYINVGLSSDAMEKLNSFKSREYSASQLEEYSKCPFRYFVKRILALEAVEEPSEELESFEIGSLIHSIFFRFYTEIGKSGIRLAGCSDEEFEEMEKLLFGIAEEKVDGIKLTSPTSFFEREKLFGINGIRRNSILYQFLLHERQSDEGFIPSYFEFSFGNFDNEESFHDVVINNIKVRGKVDRVDVDESSGRFKVVDYKLGGNKPSKDDLSRGISLQLPIYMYASKVFIEAEKNKDYQPLSAEIYSLKLSKNDFGRKSISIDTRRKLEDDDLIQMNNEIITIAANAIANYVHQIIEGEFRLSQLEDRENKVCGYCEFKSICRIRDAN